MPIYAYLTIDDGPSVEFMDKLDLLDKHHIPAVWFCMGVHLEERPEMAIEAIKRGHVIGNHSHSHPSFEEITTERGYTEIRVTDALITQLYNRAGVAQKHRYFRFPYGNKGNGSMSGQSRDGEKMRKRNALQDYLKQLGYSKPPINDLAYPELKPYVKDLDWLWTHDTVDWAAFNPTIAPKGFDTADGVLRALHAWTPIEQSDTAQEPAANLILMHDISGLEPFDLFSKMIQLYSDKGIQFKPCEQS